MRGQLTFGCHETCLYHVAASVSDCCLCHGAHQHMLLVAEVCLHRKPVCARASGRGITSG